MKKDDYILLDYNILYPFNTSNKITEQAKLVKKICGRIISKRF